MLRPPSHADRAISIIMHHHPYLSTNWELHPTSDHTAPAPSRLQVRIEVRVCKSKVKVRVRVRLRRRRYARIGRTPISDLIVMYLSRSGTKETTWTRRRQGQDMGAVDNRPVSRLHLSGMSGSGGCGSREGFVDRKKEWRSRDGSNGFLVNQKVDK